ncbi:unnamed protein product [marine sediment metagenome]|uniref:Uncharacterized protein n=1 Tax=marine sediment metagenome TaxID=412755 RepID=X1C940_9ZZZZ
MMQFSKVPVPFHTKDTPPPASSAKFPVIRQLVIIGFAYNPSEQIPPPSDAEFAEMVHSVI